MSDDKATTVEEALEQLNQAIPSDADVTVEVCGSWIWISGDTKPCKDNLKRIGCRWSSKKKQWYWRPPGAGRPWFRSSNEYSMEEIRNEYGSTQIK